MRWTEDDIKLIKRCYGFSSVEDIAKELGRTVASVRYKAKNLSGIRGDISIQAFLDLEFQKKLKSRDKKIREVAHLLDVEYDTVLWAANTGEGDQDIIRQLKLRGVRKNIS